MTTSPATSGGRPRAARSSRVVLAVLWLALGAFFLGLLRHGSGFDPWVDGWPGKLTAAMPALVCLAGVRRAGAHRVEVLAVGLGAASWLLGGLVTALAAAAGVSLSYPSVADIGYLGFFPAMLVAVVLVVRRELRGAQRTVWIDAAVGGLGAATGLALVLDPLLKDAPGGWLATVVSVAYPLGDLLLIATVTGAVVVGGLRGGSRWLWLAGGLVMFAVADVVYALRVAHHAYQLGTPLDALWSLGLTMLAVWSWQGADGGDDREVAHLSSGQTARVEVEREPVRTTVLVVPVVASAVALAVLIVAARVHLGLSAVVLAGATLVVTAARTQLAFKQAVRLADARREALTDDLTGLGNRRALYVHLRERLGSAAPARTAVLLVDLDHFKEINDTLGHRAGDEVLRLVGPRLRPVVRPSDLLVRTGGDEFALVLGEGPEGATAVARRVQERLREPFVLDGVPLRLSASVGIALCPEHADDADGLLQRADVAMYAAKKRGSGISVYDPETDLHSRERLRMAAELTDALDDGQLRLHYQPQCDVATGNVVGIEALVRWEHPTRGLLPPDVFLPLVEQSGLMGRLTLWVLQEALRLCGQWQHQGTDLRVSVNLSASNLLDDRLPEQVAELIAASEVRPGRLTLELTESMLMADPEQCRLTLDRLAALGLDLSIDDYGTGYCSLAYLHDLPVAELKLDRSFLADISDQRTAAIVHSTVELAHALHLRLVAEGVEDAQTLDALRAYGCDIAQGYFVSRPLPCDELRTWLRAQPETGLRLGAARGSPPGWS